MWHCGITSQRERERVCERGRESLSRKVMGIGHDVVVAGELPRILGLNLAQDVAGLTLLLRRARPGRTPLQDHEGRAHTCANTRVEVLVNYESSCYI